MIYTPWNARFTIMSLFVLALSVQSQLGLQLGLLQPLLSNSS